MQQERDVLVKRIFPQLRRLCEDRGATWAEVDLRWGVTDEEVAEGRAISICLDEIDRCRPFFIGLLGDRYGWIPPELPSWIERDRPWITRFRDRSLTELEIRHAALNDPTASGYSHFYLRRPGAPTPNGESEEARGQALRLQQDIRASGLPVREFHDPVELGTLVFQDFARIINELYPADSILDPIEQEAERHLAFARRQATIYVGGDHSLKRLDRHLGSNDPPLVIIGESGCGKSALLATWVAHLTGDPDESATPEPPKGGFSDLLRWLHLTRGRSTPQDIKIFARFLGLDNDVREWMGLVRSLLRQMNRQLGLNIEIPDQPEDLRVALANALHLAGAQAPVLLVLDGLDQLSEPEEAPGFYWLPRELPPNVRLVTSTAPGRLQEATAERGWGILNVQPLLLSARDELIQRALATYRKQLSPTYQAQICSAPQSGNPLFLHILLNELRVFGEHEKLGERISYYLSAPDPSSLYSRALERLEGDFDTSRPDLVRDVMTLLWAARRGLSEMEIRSFLGSREEPLPASTWLPLYLSLEGALISQAGALVFHHAQLRRAVESRYLPHKDEQRHARIELADSFAASPFTPRTSEELPWQLLQAEEWQRLRAALEDLTFFDLTWRTSPLDIQTYWTALQAHTPFRIPDSYQAVLISPENHLDVSWAVGHLLERTGSLRQATSLYQQLVAYYRGTRDHALLQTALGNLALVLRTLGDLQNALELLREQERLCRSLDLRARLAHCVGLQGVLLVDLGEPRAALAALRMEEELCRELADYRGVGRSLGNRARAYFALHELDAALDDARAQERIARESGDLISLQNALGNQALILEKRNEEPKRLLALHHKEEEICRLLGDLDGLQASLVGQARLLAKDGDSNEALELLDEQETICRKLPSPSGLVEGLLCRAALYLNANQPALALKRASEAESLVRAHDLLSQESEARRILDLASQQFSYSKRTPGHL